MPFCPYCNRHMSPREPGEGDRAHIAAAAPFGKVRPVDAEPEKMNPIKEGVDREGNPNCRMSCPICGVEHLPTPAGGTAASGGSRACPYQGVAYAELRAGHDQLYFGRWRSSNANSIDLRKAHNQLRILLKEIARALDAERLPAARKDLDKAFEALQTVEPGEDGPEALLHMDHALSYAHRVIGDLLHEKGAAPHSPGDFAALYDVAEVPFREEW